MTRRKAVRMTARVERWLAESITGRTLHIFDSTCSLINEEGDVITVANPSIDSGPFTILLDRDFDYQANLDVMDTIGAGEGLLRIGSLQVDLDCADRWDPVPDWRSIHAQTVERLAETIRAELAVSEVQPGVDFDPPPDPTDSDALIEYAQSLAGLGPGLTPSGDDVLMGVIHAWWVCFPAGAASGCSRVISETAGPRTASLSAAMLRSAAAGEAGEPWHRLIRAAAASDTNAVRDAAARILSTGHTSGADALAGFSAGLSPGDPPAP